MRDLTPEMAAEFSGRSVSPVIMAEMFFDSATIGMWTGIGTLNWGDKEFLGGGNLIGVSPIEEEQGTVAKGIVVSLNGISPTLISAALAERCRGRKFNLYLGSVVRTRYVATEDEPGAVLVEDGSGYVLLENNLLDSPYRIFSGLMDVMEITDNGETANIRLSVENALIIGQRSKVARYTMEDQKKRFPDDTGLDFINKLQDKEIVW